MKKVKAYLIIFTFLAVLLLTNSCLAANENYVVLEKTNSNYIVYLKAYLENDFEFAFSNISTTEESELNFISNAKDQVDGKNVAYVSAKSFADYFSDDNKAFVYLKVGNSIVETLEIDLSVNTSEEDVEFVKNTTKRINTDSTRLSVEVKEENGIKYTTVTGKLVITDDESYDYYYELEKMPSTDEYNRFFELAELIDVNSKFEITESLEKTQEFVKLYNELLPTEWNNPVVDLTVKQPVDSEENDKYIVWLKKVNKEDETDVTYDAQFLIARREVDEEFVKDTHTEQQVVPAQGINLLNGAIQLPVTYDSIALFIVLFILIVVLAIVIILKKKSKKNNDQN